MKNLKKNRLRIFSLPIPLYNGYLPPSPFIFRFFVWQVEALAIVAQSADFFNYSVTRACICKP
jgi:hypothetical protein